MTDPRAHSGARDTRGCKKDEKRKDRDRERAERECGTRLTGSVAQVVTGAVAEGRLARTLRRDARRRSISDTTLLLPMISAPNFPPLSVSFHPVSRNCIHPDDIYRPP